MLTYGIINIYGVWYVTEQGSEVAVAGPFLNKYMAQTERDRLNEEEHV